MVRYLTESDVQKLLTMPLALQWVEEAHRALGEQHAIDVPRARIHLPTGTQHVNAAGSNALTRRELDEAAVRKCDVVTVDGRGTARNECGDLLPAVEKGWLRWEFLAEVGEVIAGRAPGRSSDRQITLYESHGMGLQDVYVGAKVLELARSRGVGTELPIGNQRLS